MYGHVLHSTPPLHGGAITEIEPGSRGPMSVNVSMTSAPVHDLPLGMDAQGSLIAPSHPIGSFNMTDPYEEMDDDVGITRPVADLVNESSVAFNDNLATRNAVNMD